MISESTQKFRSSSGIVLAEVIRCRPLLAPSFSPYRFDAGGKRSRAISRDFPVLPSGAFNRRFVHSRLVVPLPVMQYRVRPTHVSDWSPDLAVQTFAPACSSCYGQRLCNNIMQYTNFVRRLSTRTYCARSSADFPRRWGGRCRSIDAAKISFWMENCRCGVGKAGKCVQIAVLIFSRPRHPSFCERKGFSFPPSVFLCGLRCRLIKCVAPFQFNSSKSFFETHLVLWLF